MAMLVVPEILVAMQQKPGVRLMQRLLRLVNISSLYRQLAERAAVAVRAAAVAVRVLTAHTAADAAPMATGPVVEVALAVMVVPVVQADMVPVDLLVFMHIILQVLSTTLQSMLVLQVPVVPVVPERVAVVAVTAVMVKELREAATLCPMAQAVVRAVRVEAVLRVNMVLIVSQWP